MKEALLFTGEVGSREDDCACPDKAFLLNFAYAGQEIENDCACPDHGLRLDCPRPHFSHAFTITPQTHTQPLPDSFFMAYSPYAPGGPSVLNQIAWDRWQTFAQPQPIQEEIDHELLAQGLLQPVEGQWRPRTTTAETLTAWLHITNACNLDCPYCYVQKSSARMSEATGLQAIRQIFATAQQNGFRRVKLKYAGGEATLHFKLVHRLHEEAVCLAQETGLALQEVVLSNGVYLRPTDADWLARSEVKLMISLDGVGDVHDRQRPLKGGGATFAQVQRTVDEVLRPRNIHPDITITLTGLNASGAADAVRWALQRDLPVSLNFYRPNLLTASRLELELEEQAIIAGMSAAYDVFAEMLPERPFFNGLLDRVQAEAHAHTCGVQHSYLVITHTGKLAQCQMHLDQPVQQTVNGDLIPLVAAGSIQNLSVDEKEGCRICTFRYRCTGGCPLETYRATGRWDVQSPHCHIYQRLLPEASRLEALRLLKIHGYLT